MKPWLTNFKFSSHISAYSTEAITTLVPCLSSLCIDTFVTIRVFRTTSATHLCTTCETVRDSQIFTKTFVAHSPVATTSLSICRKTVDLERQFEKCGKIFYYQTCHYLRTNTIIRTVKNRRVISNIIYNGVEYPWEWFGLNEISLNVCVSNKIFCNETSDQTIFEHAK